MKTEILRISVYQLIKTNIIPLRCPVIRNLLHQVQRHLMPHLRPEGRNTLRIRNIPQQFFIIIKAKHIYLMFTEKRDKLFFRHPGNLCAVSDRYAHFRISRSGRSAVSQTLLLLQNSYVYHKEQPWVHQQQPDTQRPPSFFPSRISFIRQ